MITFYSKSFWYYVKRSPLWALVGASFGFAVSSSILYWEERQDRLGVVVKMHGELVDATQDIVVIHITGQKLRDCNYMGVQGFMRDHTGFLHESITVRIDMKETGASKPVGQFDIGYWQLVRQQNAVAAVVFVNHDCNGYKRFSKIADVALSPS